LVILETVKYEVVIVGGGLGGLAAGAILSRQGKKVLLLEQHYIPGGCATTFKRKDFVMEAGLHAMDGHLISPLGQNSVLRYLGVRKRVQFVQIPEFFHLRSRDFSFTFPSGAENAMDALLQRYPEEEKGIRKIMGIINGVQDELSGFPRKKWKQVLTLVLFPFYYPNIFLSLRRTVGDCLDRYIRNDELKLVLQGNLLYYHDDPYTMSMAFFSKAQASFIQYGSHFIKGGSQKLSDALSDVIREQGGTLLLGKKVTRIITDRGRATGVEYLDAFNSKIPPVTVEAGSVIHSGAVPLVKHLLDRKPAERMARKTDRLKPACSLFCIYLGFSKDIRHLGNKYYSTFIFGDHVRNMADFWKGAHGDWKSKSFVFVDYSQVDSGLAPPGKSFGAICAADYISEWENLDKSAYLQKKEKVAGILLDRLEEILPGVNDLIESCEVGTPLTIRRYTLNPTGSPYGYAQIRGQVGYRRPSYRSPVKNLWLAGTGTFPGGGFTGAVISGFFCGLRVSRHLDRHPFPAGKRSHADERRVKFIRREIIAGKTMKLVFEKPPGFQFRPGQYAIVSLEKPAFTDLDIPFRSLSIASHPDDLHLEFAMRTGHSSFKKSCEAMVAGDEAVIYGPDGDFTLKNTKKGLIFITAGIGIAPVIPMLKELVKRNHDGPVFLFSCNRSEKNAPYHEWLKKPGLNQYTYIPVFTGKQGRITRSLILENLADPGDYAYYVVGGTAFVASVNAFLLETGVDEADIFRDDFG